MFSVNISDSFVAEWKLTSLTYIFEDIFAASYVEHVKSLSGVIGESMNLVGGLTFLSLDLGGNAWRGGGHLDSYR